MKTCTITYTIRTFLVLFGFVLLLASCGGNDSVESGEPAVANGVEVPAEATEAPEIPSEPADDHTVEVEPEAAETSNEPESVDVEPAEPEVAAAEIVDPVVFDDDFATSVAPIFAAKCASCHNEGGPGSVHWQLDDAADLVATHEWIATVVSTQYMPPWPASDLSLVFHDDRSLQNDEIEAIQQWSQAGAPLDVEPTQPISAPEGVVALSYDVEIGPHESYQGSTAVADDYRCFIYDPELTEPAWLKGYEFIPDQTQIVHHAIGYKASERLRGVAQELSDEDELGGWQCYGASGLGSGDQIFLGWAPGQLPTVHPEGSGMLVQPGDFFVVQIHYHFDTEAPADSSTFRLDWAEEGPLDPIEFDEFVGPAEIPCANNESGPLCDRDNALQLALERYGAQGVQADRINRLCGAEPEDFSTMTDGTASSACVIPVRSSGEIVSVFGHMHEIGSSIRMTLNPGGPDERILLDIPDWSFDWQFDYRPVEQINVATGDVVLLECAWDRARRSADLEPSYVLWADGTNDEMCFATMQTRSSNSLVADNGGDGEVAAGDGELPAPVAACLSDGGVSVDETPDRSELDSIIEVLFGCFAPEEVGELLTSELVSDFGGLVDQVALDCLSSGLSDRATAREALVFTLPDATEVERLAIGEFVGDCVPLSGVLVESGIPLAPASFECINRVGRPLLVQAIVDGELPDSQFVLAEIAPCFGN